MEPNVTIKRPYSFWRHPIRWWRERHKYVLLNVYANQVFLEHEDEIRQMTVDAMMYGFAAQDKTTGKRVDPRAVIAEMPK
jgi:hypothetical protein